MTKTRLWALIVALSLTFSSLAFAACGDDDDDGGDGGGGGGAKAADFDLITEGTLTVGTDTPFPPFEIGQPPDISGFDIEVVDEVAKRVGLQPEYIDTPFKTIFQDLAAGQFDLVVAASTITDERENAVDFSDPYYKANQALVVPTGSDIKAVEDLAGKTVGAQDGTTGETYANDETEASDVSGYPEGPDALTALRSGQVDAVIIDQPVAEDATEKQGGLEITEIPTGELYGLALPEDSDDLREAVNNALAKMKTDGTLAKLYEKYFPGVKPPKAVVSGTHEPS